MSAIFIMMTFCTLMLSCALVSPVSGGVAIQDEEAIVVSQSQQKFSARLIAVDQAWNFTFEDRQRQYVLNLRELVRWGQYRDRSTGPLIIFTDGSALVADVLAINDESITAQSRLWSTIDIPMTRLHGIVFQPPFHPVDRDRAVFEMIDSTDPQDEIELANGDRIRGYLIGTASLQDDDSRSSDASADTISIRSNRQVAEFSLSEISAIRFGDLDQPTPLSRLDGARIGFSDGSWISCSELNPRRDHIEYTLQCGVTLKSDPLDGRRDALRRIRSIEVAQEQAIEVSSLTPAGYRHQANFGHEWEYAINRSVTGSRLRVDGQCFASGIGMHASSSLAYILDGEFELLEGQIAIDESSKDRGSVIFRILVSEDGSTWNSVFESGVIRGGENPIPISVPLGNAWAITLIVEDGGDGDAMDRANWLNLRLMK